MKFRLSDIQSLEDKRGVDIQSVGVKGVEVPLVLQRKNDSDQTVSAACTMSVELPKTFKGTHMSRFVEVLNDWREKNLLGVDIKGVLEDVRLRLESNSAKLKFKFKYFVEKHAPVSGLSSVLGYDCRFEGVINGDDYHFILGVEVPVTTLCPCSKEISDYSAHNQRALVKVKISYNEKNHIWIEDLIEWIEGCASCPVYPILKREDEKFVTEKAYDNPKFVEDVLRDVVLMLRKNEVVESFEVECEAFESIHNHSAWAHQIEKKKR